jgi:hypothetical protein
MLKKEDIHPNCITTMFVGRSWSGPGFCVEKILLVNKFNGDAI